MLTKIRICKTESCVIFTRMFSKRIFSETWALPITVVIAVMAYVALASTFYNMDVWLLYLSTFDKRTLHARMYLDDEAIKTCSLNISSFDQSTLHVRMYKDYQRIKNIVYIYILRTIQVKTVKYCSIFCLFENVWIAETFAKMVTLLKTNNTQLDTTQCALCTVYFPSNRTSWDIS